MKSLIPILLFVGALMAAGSRPMLEVERDQMNGGVPNPCDALSTRFLTYNCQGPAGCDATVYKWFYVWAGDDMNIIKTDHDPCPKGCWEINEVPAKVDSGEVCKKTKA